jgi:hypothetical protein
MYNHPPSLSACYNTENLIVSGICGVDQLLNHYESSSNSSNRFNIYYRKCEYCSTINNISYEIDNCESCGAQFGLLDFLDNARIAELLQPHYTSQDTSSYKRLALEIIENAFKKHIDFHKNVDDIVNCLIGLPEEKIASLIGYLIGFIKPDKMFKTNE